MTNTPNLANFKNGAFTNVPAVPQINEGQTRFDLAKKFLFSKDPSTEPRAPIPVVPITSSALQAAQDNDETHLYRLGHSTVLMKFGSDYWLTDPVFSNRASPFGWAGPKRFHRPPIDIENLPNLKAVIISHNHYDHLDKAAIKQLIDKVELFITPTNVSKYLMKWGVPKTRIKELGWGQSLCHAGVNITATPSQHFSGRGPFDTNKSLWASFCIHHQNTRLFFGSDSGYFDGLKKIGETHGPFDLTMLECGAYDSSWPHMHMTPAQMVLAFQDLGCGVLMPIHNGTFKLAFHSWKHPFEQITALAKDARIPLLTPKFGERVTLGDAPASTPWWDDLQ